ncbi:hypothetical protein [Novipirellula caenicola]|uniref:Uncharacterized protein n=1 Tax=Novipirellula caenicola TaxID=1536901 RepID=A0ABP9VKX7_9BACT
MTVRKLAACLLPLLMISSAPAQNDREAADVGSRYEDDAWYDVSEWFDGNDYNPTDEAIGRWDDERFDYYDKQTSSDNDNDDEMVSAEEFYGEDFDDGYATYRDDDGDGTYESMSRYHDTDGDYLHDSYATYRDDDGDGLYDNYDFSQIAGENAVHRSNVAQSTQKGLSGKSHTVSGTVEQTKMVKRLGEVSLLVNAKTDDGKSMWVDFGDGGRSLQLFEGDTFTASGPMVKRGDKDVLVATTIERQGKKRQIERTGRRFTGTVQSTRKANVKGNEHLVVKLDTEDGKKLTVDMGDPAAAKDLKEGSKVTVTGVPVKVGDRVILIADSNQTQKQSK